MTSGRFFSLSLLRLGWGLLWLCLALPAQAWEREDRLAIMATDLLPAVLGAQQRFTEHYPPSKIEGSQQINVDIVFRSKHYLADQVAQRVNELTPVNQYQLKAQVYRVNEFLARHREAVKTSVGPGHIVFVIEDLDTQLDDVLAVAMKHKALSYSSRMADVDAGVAVGLSVTERVLPVVNEQTLSEINVDFSPLFMRIAKKVQP